VVARSAVAGAAPVPVSVAVGGGVPSAAPPPPVSASAVAASLPVLLLLLVWGRDVWVPTLATVSAVAAEAGFQVVWWGHGPTGVAADEGPSFIDFE